jgi:hypothetical protein
MNLVQSSFPMERPYTSGCHTSSRYFRE